MIDRKCSPVIVMFGRLIDSWIPFIVSILLGGLSLDAWYGGNKRVAVWAAYAGIILLEFLIAWKVADRFARSSETAPLVMQPPPSPVTQPNPINIGNEEKSVQRARVFIDSISNNRDMWRNGVESFKWNFRFTNRGLTAARIVRIKAFVDICDDLPRIDGDPPARPASEFYSNPMMQEFTTKTPILERGEKTEIFEAFGNRAPLNLSIALTPEAREKREKLRLMSATDRIPGAVRFWLIGRIEYRDIFSDEIHVTQFGLVLTNPFGWAEEYPDPAYNYQN